jgi:hypothetical protein
MSYFYTGILILILIFYTRIYEPFPNSISQYFNRVNEDIEGIYRSDFKHLGFNKHFMITKDVDDSKLIVIKYQGSKSDTDDPDKLLEKEIKEMRNNALNASYKFKTLVIKNENGYTIFDTDVKRDGTTLMFKEDEKMVSYVKIRDI